MEKAEKSENTTVYDDVFRTMLEKIPQMFIPLINEVFGEKYPEDTEVIQLKNEHVTSEGKKITDSHLYVGALGIGKEHYHIECQSRTDGNIAVRMIEYDFLIALENREDTGKPVEIRFPKSAVLYLRHTGNTPEKESVRILFPDGQSVLYEVPVVKVQEYSREEILGKKLTVLLPYYIMRYEKEFPDMEEDEERIGKLLGEYGEIMDRLHEESRPEIYSYMLDFISRIAEYVLRKESRLKERMREFMGGQVIRTRTDEIIEQGLRQGLEQGLEQGRQEERKNTERERKNAEQARKRAEAAEREVILLRKELELLKSNQ